MAFLCSLIFLYELVVFARILIDWFRVPFDHPVAKLRDALALVVDPVLRPMRRVIPPIRMGGMALDLSPLVLLIGLSLLQGIVC
ncbi:YGGT family protein [bacterium BMS3Abin02]|nr:YGGT family protein [bacterium BMS3Abin02]GBE23696.1 YGGT family protein [bacterium BMS3Bbin01]HDH24764.1 YggT family protein [Actinomycetota bacterium]HDK45997.1 YggT family protein [Actinomycetota bacterium]HDL48875.1 YggT family protein [Actinomycetota bacterium]